MLAFKVYCGCYSVGIKLSVSIVVIASNVGSVLALSTACVSSAGSVSIISGCGGFSSGVIG